LTARPAIDQRTLLARPDLADQALEGVVRASAFRTVRPMHGTVAVADIHSEADAGSERIDQLLSGEAFDVLDQRGDYVWGRARRDGTVGWIAVASLGQGVPHPTHRIASVTGTLPLNALVTSDHTTADLAPIGSFETDPVAVAERLLGVPHSLGARSSVATDCSGLVQQVLYACGRAGPRHSDEQAELGQPIERADIRRGDIVVWLNANSVHSWTGHSALVHGPDTVIHATGHHGCVVIESMAEAEARYAADGFAAPVFRRLP